KQQQPDLRTMLLSKRLGQRFGQCHTAEPQAREAIPAISGSLTAYSLINRVTMSYAGRNRWNRRTTAANTPSPMRARKAKRRIDARFRVGEISGDETFGDETFGLDEIIEKHSLSQDWFPGNNMTVPRFCFLVNKKAAQVDHVEGA